MSNGRPDYVMECISFDSCDKGKRGCRGCNVWNYLNDIEALVDWCEKHEKNIGFVTMEIHKMLRKNMKSN